VKQSPQNRQRARRARRCLPDTEDPISMHIIDMLADLRHLCDRQDLDFASLDRQAYDHYCVEVRANRQDPPSARQHKEPRHAL
jgi:hypothetical protein